MLVTDNDEYAAKARLLRAHGVVRNQDYFQGLGTTDPILEERGPWYYEMQSLGYNGRITDFQCALGITQLEKLPNFIDRRREIVARYNEAFLRLPWFSAPRVLREEDHNEISWHLYTARFDFEVMGKTRSEVMASLRDAGVGTQVLYIPVHLQPWYRETYGYSAGKCPQSEDYYRDCLSLPLYPEMSDENIAYVISAVKNLV